MAYHADRVPRLRRRPGPDGHRVSVDRAVPGVPDRRRRADGRGRQRPAVRGALRRARLPELARTSGSRRTRPASRTATSSYRCSPPRFRTQDAADLARRARRPQASRRHPSRTPGRSPRLSRRRRSASSRSSAACGSLRSHCPQTASASSTARRLPTLGAHTGPRCSRRPASPPRKSPTSPATESLGSRHERHAARRYAEGPLPAALGRPALVEARRADARGLGRPPRDRRPPRRRALHGGEHVPLRRHRAALARHGQDLGARRGDRPARGVRPQAREDVARPAGARGGRALARRGAGRAAALARTAARPSSRWRA